MENEITNSTDARELKKIIVTNSYLVDLLRSYCEDNSNIGELSGVAPILDILSEKQTKALSLVSQID